MAFSFIGHTDLPIGLRNNNPGDIKTGIAWQGMTGSEGPFVTFQDITWGTRALAIDLMTKIGKDGLDTITKILDKYAPPLENDTLAYIAAVSNETGLDPDEQLGADADTLHSLMRAIIDHELGQPYGQMVQEEDIDQGIGMAMGSGSSLAAALPIALANPVPYVDAVAPLQWVGLVAAIAAVVYISTRKN